MSQEIDPDACYIQFIVDYRNWSAGDMTACDQRSAASYFRDGLARPAPCAAIHRMYLKEIAKQNVAMHGRIMLGLSLDPEPLKVAAHLSQQTGVPMDDLL